MSIQHKLSINHPSAATACANNQQL